MRVNHNLSAVVANNKLKGNEDMVAQSMERLSSGLRLNHAKDDPAGMAISNRMTTQIDGIDQASRNAQDASSLIETADGALNEVTSIIQRMNELAVQAASDTYTPSDKQAIQNEITELKTEIDRMARDTEFNTKTLLNGDLDQRVYSSKITAATGAYAGLQVDAVERISISDFVPAGNYSMTITSATQAVTATDAGSTAITSTALQNTAITAAQAGSVTINGYGVDIEEGDTYSEVLQKIQETAQKGETVMTYDNNGAMTFTSTAYGASAQAEISCDNANLSAILGLGTLTQTAGTNADVSIISGDFTDASGNTVTSDFGEASWSAEGNKITIQQNDGFKITFLASDNMTDQQVDLEVTTMGSLQIQIGANEGQTMDVRIPEVTTESLYIDDLDVTTVNGANRAMASLQAALQQVTDVRARIGAYENRLGYASDSLDSASENLTSALSRVEDIDMASEMTQYTQYNVLVQASTSVLAQANDLPQQVLELLR